MSACEKCWADAYTRSICTGKSQAECYGKLIEERKDNPCSPEEQAGHDAGICPICNRKCLHQITGECMNPNCKYKELIYEWNVPDDYPNFTGIDDIAQAYRVYLSKKASGGIIVYAKYNNKWSANPFTSRPLIKHLIDKIKDKEVKNG